MAKTGDEKPTVLTEEQASQGYTVLRTPVRKAVFLGGLALFVILAAVLSFFDVEQPSALIHEHQVSRPERVRLKIIAHLAIRCTAGKWQR